MSTLYRQVKPSALTKGDRIATEHGNATVEYVYPDAPTGVWGRWFVMVLPDGYAAGRTVEFNAYEFANVIPTDN